MKKIVDSVFVVGGLARDCESNLAKNLEEIEKIRGKVKELYICILENDSSDNTPRIMDDFCNTHKNILTKHFKETQYDVNTKTGTSMSRICRLSKYRNMLLDLMEGISVNPDYCIMIDWDLDEFDSSQIIQAIETAPSNWGAIFANGRYKWQYKDDVKTGYRDKKKIYDSFAVLEDNKDIESILQNDNNGYHRFHVSSLYGHLLNNNEYVPCTSAFGGIGIYKYEAIIGCRYSTKPVGDWFICEHIFLNYMIKNRGYKNYMCASLETSVLMIQRRRLTYVFNKYLPSLHDFLLSIYLRIKRLSPLNTLIIV